jgi:regulator of RNase E activity RraB
MGILDLFRSKAKADPDQSVLAHLGRAGSDLSKPHRIEFFLYFPTQPIAEKAATSIRGDGFEVEVSRAAQGDNWLCFAKKKLVPELTDLQEIRRNFITLTASLGGEYDGWGTQVIK